MASPEIPQKPEAELTDEEFVRRETGWNGLRRGRDAMYIQGKETIIEVSFWYHPNGALATWLSKGLPKGVKPLGPLATERL